MYIIEITEDKLDNVIEHMSKGLKYFNKAIECLEEAKTHSSMNKRGPDYDKMDEDFDDYEDEERYGNRGGRRNNRGGGRYSRY